MNLAEKIFALKQLEAEGSFDHSDVSPMDKEASLTRHLSGMSTLTSEVL